MNRFLRDLFKASASKDLTGLGDYDDEDLNDFFESGKENPKRFLLELAKAKFPNLENQTTSGSLSTVRADFQKQHRTDHSITSENKRGTARVRRTPNGCSTKKVCRDCPGSLGQFFFSPKKMNQRSKEYAVTTLNQQTRREGK